ncbi:MAG: glycosyltransferase family 4 protein [Bacteroidales bacterium]|nr:glycosyltransferase family 4 protein [Bacteroidales bacterium]
MKILLLGDASNCHRTLAIGLRDLGHEVTVASDGTRWMQTERDIDLSRHFAGPTGGAGLYLRSLRLTATRFRDFDVVAIHNPIFLSLRPGRVRRIFDIIRRNNRSIFLTALGTDTPYVEECLDPDGSLRYSEYMHLGKPSPMVIENPDRVTTWTGEAMTAHCRHIYNNVDGAVAVLYEYLLSARRWLPEAKTAYGGIPIDMNELTLSEIPERPEKVRFFLGRHKGRLAAKGTDRLELAARRAIERHPEKAELIIVENRPYKEYIELLSQAHVVIDQAYSYTPATNALLAMAKGQCAVSGAEPEFYNFIGENRLHPIFNSPLDTESMTSMFEQIITSPPGELRRRGLEGREFVKKHNAAPVVAARFADFWQRRLELKNQFSTPKP